MDALELRNLFLEECDPLKGAQPFKPKEYYSNLIDERRKVNSTDKDLVIIVIILVIVHPIHRFIKYVEIV